jgi:uncharacterized protein (TIGR03435 family)
MHDATDMDLLRQYAVGNSDAAFAALVSRHVDLVYSAALRKTGNPHAAEEITQAVFIILAQKAGRILDKTILPGWLYQTARLTASSFLRRETRRVRREQEAYMQSQFDDLSRRSETKADETWEQLAPLLEDAMGQLGDKDRAAVVLRFFGGKSFAEVGTAAGVSENAAKKRVIHALEKLHRYFAKRGVSSTTAIIAGAISANSVQAAPVALAKTVSAVAIAKGAAASGSTLTLIKGALKIMAWTKMKTAAVVGIAALLAAGTTTITVKEIQEHRTYPWQIQPASRDVVDRQPPQVRIQPSRFTHDEEYAGTGDKYMATGNTAQDVVTTAYDSDLARTVFSPDVKLPGGLYDFIASLPSGNVKAFQREVSRKFGVVGKVETREADVLLLKLKSPNAPRLKRSMANNDDCSMSQTPGQFHCKNGTLANFAGLLEQHAGIPILDRTSVTNRFDIDLNCKQAEVQSRNLDKVNQALDQIGLELVPSREPIEMLVVEKAK